MNIRNSKSQLNRPSLMNTRDKLVATHCTVVGMSNDIQRHTRNFLEIWEESLLEPFLERYFASQLTEHATLLNRAKTREKGH